MLPFENSTWEVKRDNSLIFFHLKFAQLYYKCRETAYDVWVRNSLLIYPSLNWNPLEFDSLLIKKNAYPKDRARNKYIFFKKLCFYFCLDCLEIKLVEIIISFFSKLVPKKSTPFPKNYCKSKYREIMKFYLSVFKLRLLRLSSSWKKLSLVNTQWNGGVI